MAPKGQVLAELQFTLGQMERAVQANPHDRTLQTHILVLNQVIDMFRSSFVFTQIYNSFDGLKTLTELRQILDQLRSLAQSVLESLGPEIATAEINVAGMLFILLFRAET